MFNRSSIQNHKKSVIFIVALTLLAGVAANGAGIINIPTAGYLLCVNSKTKVVTHPGTATCPKGTKGLVVGSKGQDGVPGLTGATGLNGQNGRDGIDGKTLWNGTKDPESTWGSPGDMFINSVTKTLFGPKNLDGTWPIGVSLVGPKGDQGPMGLPGINGSNGANGATGPQGATGLTGATGVAAPVATTSNCIGIKCTYKIGDTGPGGGTIFFVDYNDQYVGFNYLEAAPISCQGAVSWSQFQLSVNGAGGFSDPDVNLLQGLKGRAAGAGRTNTAAIKDRFSTDTSANNAAYFATQCGGSKNDWFLGSLGEMKLMYDNLQGVWEFWTFRFWWSSSDYDDDTAWGKDFKTGEQYAYAKTYEEGHVRPVRSFL
jgi:hypothetical protein